MGKTAETVLRHPKKILVVMILVSVVLATGATQIKTGFDFIQFLPQDNPALQLFDKIVEDFPYAGQDQEYILIEGNIATTSALKGFSKTHKNLEDNTYVSRKTDGTAKSMSIYTMIQQAVENNNSLIEKYDIDQTTSIPKTNSDVQQLYDYLYTSEEYGAQVKSVLFRNNGRYEAAVIRVFIDSSFQTKEGDINEDLELLKKELNDDVEGYGDADAVVIGNFILRLVISESLIDSQIISTAFALMLAAIVIIIAYRNPILGLISMIPVGISILWILGTIYYL
jgi:predicted RND superfamily exporter protein